MLHKIQRIASIGRYRDYSATGSVHFRKITLFYGENGGGKTTLTSILRSLTLNNPNLVQRRISTNATIPQAAQIIERVQGDDTHYTFNPRNGWSRTLPNIEVFDIHFIDENIFSGFEFNEDHKRQLHHFVIGAQGVALQQQIAQNKLDKTACRSQQTALEQQLIQRVGHSITEAMLPGFLSTPSSHAANIDQRIVEAQITLNSANANTVIRALPDMTLVSKLRPGVEWDPMKEDIIITSDIIQDDVLKHLFEAHCEDLSINALQSPNTWLRSGFAYVESKSPQGQAQPNLEIHCPFCQQKMGETVEILKAYALMFNESFNRLTHRLKEYLPALRNFNLNAGLQAINIATQNNSERIITWSNHLPVGMQPPNLTPIDQNRLNDEYAAAISCIEEKLQNPSQQIDNTPILTFETSIATANAGIDNYNRACSIYNTAIATFKTAIPTREQAQSELDRLNRIRLRFTAPIVAICTNIQAEKNKLTALNTAYSALVAQEAAAAATFFLQYSSRVNHYLDRVFKTPFKITDVEHIPPQGRATQSKIGYKLTINGQEISFNPDNPNSAKDCLSEGDKSTIAFALFVSKLDIDPSAQDKIVVFDDPLSSFDRNRRRYTVQILKDLISRVKQLIVLSHNELFLHDIYKCFPPSERTSLQITTNFATDSSTIQGLDLESLVETEYFRHVKALDEFLLSPDLTRKENILGMLRTVLEAHIRFKFYRQLRGIPTNNQTFGTIIQELINQNVVFRDNTNRDTIIDTLKLINNVSCKPHHGEPQPDYTLPIDPNTISITELASLVQDTLSLIDTEI